jgi:hypothetical protein
MIPADAMQQMHPRFFLYWLYHFIDETPAITIRICSETSVLSALPFDLFLLIMPFYLFLKKK